MEELFALASAKAEQRMVEASEPSVWIRRKEEDSVFSKENVEYRIPNFECRRTGMAKVERIFDLEDRLINLGVRIMRLAQALPKTRVGNHIAGQIIRCGTSPASNYGEAQSSESRPDFIHRMRVCLKELRETRVWLLMTAKANLMKSESQLDPLIDETDQLISIFVTSIQTARQKQKRNDDTS